MSTEKRTGRKPRTQPQGEAVQETVNVQQPQQTQQSQPQQQVNDNVSVDNWARQSKKVDEDPDSDPSLSDGESRPSFVSKKKELMMSLLNFDRNEVASLETQKVSDVDFRDLLKVLIRRGELADNNTLHEGCKMVLCQLKGIYYIPNDKNFRKFPKTPRFGRPDHPGSPNIRSTPNSEGFVNQNNTNVSTSTNNNNNNNNQSDSNQYYRKKFNNNNQRRQYQPVQNPRYHRENQEGGRYPRENQEGGRYHRENPKQEHSAPPPSQ